MPERSAGTHRRRCMRLAAAQPRRQLGGPGGAGAERRHPRSAHEARRTRRSRVYGVKGEARKLLPDLNFALYRRAPGRYTQRSVAPRRVPTLPNNTLRHVCAARGREL